ncbi:hypothetical protein DRI50_05325, partial [candidate division KSB1 bacterium]
MKLNKKRLLMLALLSLAILALTGCYTQIGQTGGVRTDVNDDDDYYADQNTNNDDYWNDDDQRAEQADDETVVYHHYDHDVYVHDDYAPIYLNAWWYEPYWYYTAEPWAYRTSMWDPYGGAYSFYGDPYYWPDYTYIGGGGYYHNPYHWYHTGYSMPVVAYPVYIGA